MRQAAAAEIMPRFRRLAEHEIDEKSGPHDLVTDADRKAEAYLTEALVKLLPGSVVVGRRPSTPTRRPTTPCAATPPSGSSTPSTAPGSSCTATPASARWSRSPRAASCTPRGHTHRSTTGWPRPSGARAPSSTECACTPAPRRRTAISRSPPPTRTTRRTTRSAHCSACRPRDPSAVVRFRRTGIPADRAGPAGRDGLLLGSGLGPRGRASAGRGGGRCPPHPRGRAVPHHRRQRPALHRGQGRGHGPPGAGPAVRRCLTPRCPAESGTAASVEGCPPPRWGVSPAAYPEGHWAWTDEGVRRCRRCSMRSWWERGPTD